MKRIPWSRFEMLAERLVEGSFRRLFGGQLEPMEVAYQLARALDDAQADGMEANYFLVRLHPQDYTALNESNPNLAADLSASLQKLAQQAGLVLPVVPTVELVADGMLAARRVSVLARRREAEADETTRLFQVPDAAQVAQDALDRLDAYLVVDGRRHVPLNQPIVTIGRRVDNDIVLDAAAVSRQHAQLRWRYGRFILFDLSNRGRTAVNGEVVSEHVLQPGDVITLSNVLLIYGEGDTGVRRAVGGDSAKPDGETLLWPKET